jgi:16S rRNA (adenine1518-N6/adenine1519-N6)-dimethyltransferase
VAERVSASPGTSAFGSLSVLMQISYEIRLGSMIPPGAFRPAPKVDSQIIVGWRRESSLKFDSAFNDFVKLSFLFKRKRLRFALRKSFSDTQIKNLYDHMSWSENIRAEEIAPADWAKAYEVLKNV